MPVIALTTDFGMRDHYVAAMKGVILGIAPQATIVDVSHEIEAHNVLHGAVVLRQAWPWFPVGTIHVAVVDPGVGTERRILLAQYGGRLILAPDNGLITFLHREFPVEGMYLVENRQFFSGDLSNTFHGRDIMAPAAAHLAKGVKPREFGRLADRVEVLPVPVRAEAVGESLVGVVLYVDRFGTLVTNVRQEQLATPHGHPRPVSVVVDGTPVGPIRSTYAEVPVGEPLALVGSSGYLEVAVNQGRAIDRFGPAAGVRIEMHGAS